MRKQLFSTFLVLFALLLATPGQAQVQTPAPSQFAKMETTVGLTEVHLAYSRPSMKGRTIFGEGGLVPYDQIWRTGANSATKITFGDDVMISGAKLAGGSYAVLTKPGKSSWTIMFFPYESGSWNSYVEKSPAAMVTALATTTNHAIETFTIDVNHLTMEGAHLVFSWDKTTVAVPFTVEVKDRVMANIDRVMAGPSSGDYYQAASFMNDAGLDNEKALDYIQKANGMMDSPRFWMVRREALILADLGRTSDAIATAKKSMELAREAGNADYVRLNEKSIAEWSRR